MLASDQDMTIQVGANDGETITIKLQEINSDTLGLSGFGIKDPTKLKAERPLRADLALIRAHRCDTLGNLTYQLSARNFNPLIALAADITLVEPDELVETGELQPDHIVTPGAVIDHIIVSQESK